MSSSPTRGTLPPKKKRSAPKGPVAPEGAAVEEPSSEADRHSLCVEVLLQGYVQSYVDFFYLTHRPDPNPDASADGEKEQEIDIASDDMLFIRDHLTQAEASRRLGETKAVYSHYDELAQHFNGAEDNKTGVYFYEKCLEISRLTQDHGGEMSANHSLGKAHEALGDVENAIKFHESHLHLATRTASADEQKRANDELINVYKAFAAAKEETKDYHTAVQYHQRCLESCMAAQNRVAQGLANYHLGRAYVMLDDPERAITFLNDYLQISKEQKGNSGRDSEGSACAALAAAYNALNDTDKAIKFLEEYWRIAKETDNLQAQGEACCQLGVIYNKRGEFQNAVTFFETNFEIARNIVSSGSGDRKLVDAARVNLGMAKGNAQMGAYLHVINTDIVGLLRWKNRRVNFASKQG